METQELPQDLSIPAVPTDPAAGPVVLDPAHWEDFEGFRETFLLNFSDPGDNAALRSLGRVLYHLILEAAHVMPGPPDGWIRTHLRAAVADLRFLQGFLSFIGEERQSSDLPADDEDLCRTVARKARSLGRIADGIEARLAGEEPSGSSG